MPNNNLFINSGTPVLQGDQTRKVFTREWFRVFSDIVSKVKMLNGDTSTAATAGTADPLPPAPAGYMTINDLNGNPVKIPYYNP